MFHVRVELSGAELNPYLMLGLYIRDNNPQVWAIAQRVGLFVFRVLPTCSQGLQRSVQPS